MNLRQKRRLDYENLSTWFQRVVLRLEPRTASTETRGATSAAEAARYARTLESSAREPAEAVALQELGNRLRALQEAEGDRAKRRSYAAVLLAADALGATCPEFANPPLNAIWADAKGVVKEGCRWP